MDRKKTRIVFCDQDAFYPFRSLVEGHIRSPEELVEAERFIRGILLHDEVVMEYQPIPAPLEEPEWTEEQIAFGARNVITAFGPTLDGYEELVSMRKGPHERLKVQLAPSLLKLAEDFSGAGPGDPYHEAHVYYIGRLVTTVRDGGSAICAGEVGTAVIKTSSSYPEQLFSELDRSWQEYAQAAHGGDIGLKLPPMLAVILSRTQKREYLPTILRDLRDEWAAARAKVWGLIDELSTAATLEQANDIKKQLQEASKLLLPGSLTGVDPVRILWELVSESGAGAVEAQLSGGNPLIGAAAGIVKGFAEATKESSGFARVLFGRGAFDLAKKVSHLLSQVEPIPGLLNRLLSEDEKVALGLK